MTMMLRPTMATPMKTVKTVKAAMSMKRGTASNTTNKAMHGECMAKQNTQFLAVKLIDGSDP